MMDSKSEIAGIASTCWGLFNACLSEGPDEDVLATLEGEQSRFRAWSNSLKVFARSHVNLDAQLRPTANKQIREMVLLLLEVLRDNLSLALNSISSKEGPEPMINYLKVPFFGIDGSLKRLERLAAAILDATEASLHRRVYAYAEKNRDEWFERLVWQVILARFPCVVPASDLGVMLLSASEETESSDEAKSLEDFRALLRSSSFSGLFRALFESTLFRHYRMIYERERRLKDLNQPPPVKESPQLTERVAYLEPLQEHRRPVQPPPARFTVLPSQVNPPKLDDERSEQTLPNTIDEPRFRAKMEVAEDHETAGALGDSTYPVSESGDAMYPRPPRLPKDATEGICLLCGQCCPADTFEGEKWMIHVAQDVKPYVCISEDCMQNPQFFARSKQWKQHMYKIHTTQWIRSMNNTLLWKCPMCHSTSAAEFVSEEKLQQSLVEHMSQEHSKLDEDGLQSLASVSGIPKPRPIDICPICSDDHKPKGRQVQVPQGDGGNLDDKAPISRAARESQRPRQNKQTRFNVPDSSESESEKDDVGNPARRAQVTQQPDGRSLQASDHNRIEKHIGQHLKALAFFFSNRLVRDWDRESDAQQGSDADSSLIDLESLSEQESEDDSPRLPPAIGRFEDDPDPDEATERVACIASSREALRSQWGGDRRTLEPNLPPEQLELFFPITPHRENDALWKPLGPGSALVYAALVLIVLELCQPVIPRPLLFHDDDDEELLPYKSLEAFSMALRGFHDVVRNANSKSDFVLAIGDYASKGLLVSSRLLSGLVSFQDLIGVTNKKGASDRRDITETKQNIEFRIALARLNYDILPETHLQDLDKIAHLDQGHLDLLKDVTTTLMSREPNPYNTTASLTKRFEIARQAGTGKIEPPETDVFSEQDALFVRYLFPHAKQSLRDQLASSLVNRGNRMRHNERLIRPRTPAESKLNPEPAASSQFSTPQFEKRQPDLSRQTPPSLIRGSHLSTTTASKFSDTRQRKPVPVVSTRLSVGMASTEYPNMPIFAEGDTYCACPYCNRPLETSLLKQNPKYWQRHLDEDIQPYMCLSEDCKSPLLFFSQAKDWIDHMKGKHSDQWNRVIHTSTWYCDIGHDNTLQFDDHESFLEHMKNPTNHPGQGHPTDIQLRNISQEMHQSYIREEFVCPMCDVVPESLQLVIQKTNPEDARELLYRHIASHLKSLAFGITPALFEAEAYQEPSETDNGGVWGSSDDGSMASYTYQHSQLRSETSLNFDENPAREIVPWTDEFNDEFYGNIETDHAFWEGFRLEARVFMEPDHTLENFARFQLHAQDPMDNTREQPQAQTDAKKQELSSRELECLEMFRTQTYERYKDTVPRPVERTCQWFLKHAHFQQWLEQDSGLLISLADPGRGKSVLARHLVDNVLPRFGTICYYFFSEDKEDLRNLESALCALLHQLFSQNASLVHHAIEDYVQKGESLIYSTELLWNILAHAIQDPQAGSVIVVLDALDKCYGSGLRYLLNRLGRLSRDQSSRIKFLLISRPHEYFTDGLRKPVYAIFSTYIRDEENLDAISQEISLVVRYRIHHLAKQRQLSEELRDTIEQNLMKFKNFTYLWVCLVLDDLERQPVITLKSVTSALSSLPKTVVEAYESILSRSIDRKMAREVLSVVLAATRPLSLVEITIAVFHSPRPRDSIPSSIIRECCGFFVSLHHGKTYLIHETAREFLLADHIWSTSISSSRWQHSIDLYQAHRTTAQACVNYLDRLNSDTTSPRADNKDELAFLDYSSKNWSTHVNLTDMGDVDSDMISSIWSICDPSSRSYSLWFKMYWETVHTSPTPDMTLLTVVSYFGIEGVVDHILNMGDNINEADKLYGQTPLSWAAKNGHESTVELLLANKADKELKSVDGCTPLHWAARNGHEATIVLLLKRGADIESRDNTGRTPLSWATGNGHKTIVLPLIRRGANIESMDNTGRTPLSWAVQNSHVDIIPLLEPFMLRKS